MTHWVFRAAAMRPDRVALALAGTGGQLSYAELVDRARAQAGALIERGVSPGDKVGIALPAGADFVVALHGCFLCGAVAVPLDLRLAAAERAARAAGCVVVVDEPLAGRAGRFVHSPLVVDSPATVMHTSGTTSAPRPVELTFGNWLANALGSAIALGLDLEERWLCPLPLAHVGGLSILLRSAVYGTTVVLQERFDAAAACSLLMDPSERITLVSVVPTMLARMLDAGLREPPALRWALLGGGPIPRPLMWRAVDAGIPVAPTYGMTEACSQIATFRWPLPGVELRLGSDGEVLVRGPMVSSAALAGDGWLHTGDLGSLDGRGRLTITGRKADTIITGGENVAPVEVEAVLLEHQGVADAAVFGRADPEWGEAVIAQVVLREGASVDGAELREFCVGRLAGFKIPKTVEVVGALPRTEFGKLLRRELA